MPPKTEHPLPSALNSMSRNILELKSTRIAPEKVATLSAAQRVRRLKDFDLNEEYFQPVYHPADLVENIGQWEVARSYEAEVPVADIKGTTHPSYYGLNWLQMLMSLERHKEDMDEASVRRAICDGGALEPIRLSKFGELYFIDGGGNHRVCQARMLGVEKVICEVTEYHKL